MNEWEWQLLEAKKPVDDLRIDGIEVQAGKPRPAASAAGRRHHGHRARRQDRRHRRIEQDYEGKFTSVLL